MPFNSIRIYSLINQRPFLFFILSTHYRRLNIQPDVSLAAALLAYRMAFNLPLSFGYDFGRFSLVRLEGAGNFHFRLVSAVFALTGLSEFVFFHISPPWVVGGAPRKRPVNSEGLF